MLAHISDSEKTKQNKKRPPTVFKVVNGGNLLHMLSITIVATTLSLKNLDGVNRFLHKSHFKSCIRPRKTSFKTINMILLRAKVVMVDAPANHV